MQDIQAIKEKVSKADKLIVEQGHLKRQLDILYEYNAKLQKDPHTEIELYDMTICVTGNALHGASVPLSVDTLDCIIRNTEKEIDKINNQLLEMFK